MGTVSIKTCIQLFNALVVKSVDTIVSNAIAKACRFKSDLGHQSFKSFVVGVIGSNHCSKSGRTVLQ